MTDQAPEDAVADAVQLRNEFEAPIAGVEPCAPLLKWLGGKARLLPEITKRMPRTFGRYYEPFAGGAALFFRLARSGSVLGDLNADLMTTYRAVAADMPTVCYDLLRKESLHTSPAYSDGFYYFQRDIWNQHRHRWTEALRAATMLYLNRTCYNGLWRTNKSGEMNSPQGRYAKVTICDPQRIAACSAVLRQATLVSGGYRETLDGIKAGDFAYLDPPYAPASPTANFTSYNPDGFTGQDQIDLATYAAELVARGAYVMLSNSDTKFVRNLYRKNPCWRLHRVKARRAINSKGDARGPVGELLITGGYEVPRSRRKA